MLKVEVEVIALALAQRRYRLPSGSAVSGEGTAHRTSHVTLWPLAPMTVEDALACGLATLAGVNCAAYEAAVRVMQEKEQRR
jgi:hypothetical protein